MTTPDTAPLLQFIDFLSEEFDLDKDQQKSAKKIRATLANLEENSDEDCSMSLDIYDTDIQTQQSDRKGVYWREWSVFLEAGLLEVRARSNAEPDWLKAPGFHLEWSHDLQSGKQQGNGSLQDWLDDARNYKEYITEHLNEVEVEFDAA